MSKTKQKNQNPRYDLDVIEKLHETYSYTRDYIRKSIRGDRVGIMPERIKKEYYQMVNAAKKAKEEKFNQILND
ncbi:hypothetical protein [Psychroflexus sp. ALD_RP9]|uniref:hypothetical protein n=1 Tax=Psychroflexus sp. ALD_RP9 TaxID=2777186 RepID=UPI001A8F927F|nr:hypothetical protein [Psychroflexus sp. ALD_RP9]QSS96621.1 hypothetical protein IMZ30_09225 [Psychroflexus sp. ALD_RP9]